MNIKLELKFRISKCESISSNRKRPTTASVSTATAQEEVLCDVDESSFTLSTELLIAADGTSRTVANQMESDDKTARAAMNPVRRLFAKNGFRVTRYEDDNQRIYKTIPLALPENWRHDLNYSARTNRFNIDALPADDKGNYCGVLLLKNGDALAEADTDTKELRAFFDKSLPQFGALIDEQQMEQIAIKPPSYLPSFRYVGPRLNQGDRTVIIGDCAHTVKPYFGLGANSALEDVSVSHSLNFFQYRASHYQITPGAYFFSFAFFSRSLHYYPGARRCAQGDVRHKQGSS